MHATLGPGYGGGTGHNCVVNGMSLMTKRSQPSGSKAAWHANAPHGLALVGAWIPPANLSESGVNNGTGHSGSFYWRGGSVTIANLGTWKSPRFESPYFGWRVVCRRHTCSGRKEFARVVVYEIQLKAEESRAPTLMTAFAQSLWSQRGWVRGEWPVTFKATDPSGVCRTQMLVDGQTLNGPSGARDPRSWHQCPDQVFTHWVNTSDFVPNEQGTFPLTLRAMNAAGVWTADRAWTREMLVDNVPPTVRLSGPANARSTNGTQYITATATAGPSGVAGILCSVDAAPPKWYPSSIVRLPVQGIGTHRAHCVATNHAKSTNGSNAVSAPASWTLSIRQPALSTVAFVRVVSNLRCHKRHERVRIPAQWIIRHIHGKRVRVHIPAQTRSITVTKCHPRVIKVRVRRHGHWVTERVVLLPRRIRERTKHIRFGATATVRGWLGTAQGTALAHQRVVVLTAPDNGKEKFTAAAVVTTRANGSWSARLRPGPSRLVRAYFGGNATVEPSLSTAAHLIVPASVGMSLSPRRTHWGDTIKIAGRVRGGYVPPSGELVVLRIGWKGGSTEIGHLYTARNGTFRSTYTFLRGNGSETYHLWAATAKESDYPFAPARSPSVKVTVDQ